MTCRFDTIYQRRYLAYKSIINVFIINKVKAVEDNEENCEENIMEAEENKDKETIVDN